MYLKIMSLKLEEKTQMIDNLIEITKTNSDCAQYTGTVTIASYLGERLVQKETHHNAGLKTLFEFLGSCLQGNWYEARDKRPCKLVMLKAAAEEQFSDSNKSIPTNKDTLDYWSAKYAICSPIMYDTAATTSSNATSTSVNYHFRVPFLSLVGGSKIKKLLLLPPIATDYPTEACAYFILDKEIDVPVAGSNFTVVIDWTLTFTNSTIN
jgi:hypothetical protein